MKQFETGRLIIRNFTSKDSRDLYEYLSLESVLKYEPGEVCSEDDCKRLALERSSGDTFWAVCLKETGKMIGHVYFGREAPDEFMTWEIGYIFNPVFYGKGYATEACRRIMQYGFDDLHAHRIIALCNPENNASWKLLERLSMRREGHFLKKAFFRKNADGSPMWHDAYEYAILSDEWEGTRSKRLSRESGRMMEPSWAFGLSMDQIEDIRKLEEACCKDEKLNMKLNREMLCTRPSAEKNDLLCYAGNELIAFLGLYGIAEDGREIEITGMVHPGYRRKGIFTSLLNMAIGECARRGAERVLLIAEKSVETGMGFIKSTKAGYAFSEYRMKCNLDSIFSFQGAGIQIRKGENKDYPEFISLDNSCFKAGLEESDAAEAYKTTYAAELEGKSVGKIGMIMEGEEGYIFGFAIKPEFRGKGYGREVLKLTLNRFKSEQAKSVCLEVAVENENALTLYKTCGFREVSVYNYYKILL